MVILIRLLQSLFKCCRKRTQKRVQNMEQKNTGTITDDAHRNCEQKMFFSTPFNVLHLMIFEYLFPIILIGSLKYLT